MKRDCITLIGTKGGPAVYPNGSMPTSTLLRLDEQVFVVDCGLGVTAGIIRQGVSLTQIRAIFITHLHSDHYLELGPLLHTAWTAGLSRPVRVFAPPGIERYWRYFLASVEFDVDIRMVDEGRCNPYSLVEFVIITDELKAQLGTVNFSVMPNCHPPLEESYAFRFDGSHRSVTFSGDTTYLEGLAEFASRSDVLVHEAMLVEGVERVISRVGNAGEKLRKHLHASHTRAEDAGRIATAAEVGRLVVNHKIPSDDPDFADTHWEEAIRATWQGKLTIAEDGVNVPLD